MEKKLNKIIENNKDLTLEGEVATYIPELGKANAKDLGICIADMEGNIYKAGDYNKKFTIQSISKTISLMMALMDNGKEIVFDKVGMEPTGDAFNSIIKLETIMPSRPLNPMINAGAIVVSSLIKGKDKEEKFNRLLSFMKKISENDNLEIDNEVYLSEKKTGHRNRAMAYFMKDVGIIEGDIEDILDVYFKQCSIKVDCVDLAKMGLFLANQGILPSTGQKLVSEDISRIVKTFMVTCGMYNGSGEFAIKVGIPAKSGVGGGIMASIPHRMGIATFGPSLDDKGNSIGGYKALYELSKELNLSIF
ncbi:glutaminase A [Senegalia sp. (in: firmicutes)]|uniref:glutaminase A n=1 Tax=Senegalia sp. (in: firmicutes) TaxID=1924098 RepID=UPI003F98F8CF